MPLHVHHDLRERHVAPTVIDNFPEVWRRSWEDFAYALSGCEFRATYRAGELRWDDGWRAPLLDEFATSHLDTPFPRRS